MVLLHQEQLYKAYFCNEEEYLHKEQLQNEYFHNEHLHKEYFRKEQFDKEYFHKEQFDKGYFYKEQLHKGVSKSLGSALCSTWIDEVNVCSWHASELILEMIQPTYITTAFWVYSTVGWPNINSDHRCAIIVQTQFNPSASGPFYHTINCSIIVEVVIA